MTDDDKTTDPDPGTTQPSPRPLAETTPEGPGAQQSSIEQQWSIEPSTRDAVAAATEDLDTVDARPSTAGDGARTDLGRYPVTGVLGKGGMGEVLQVRDRSLGREMAAKLILGTADSRSTEKFLLEAQVTGQLEHPGIPPVHELDRAPDGAPYFTMKRVQGRDLAAVLKRQRSAERRGGTPPLSLSELLEVFVKVCDAMAFAHSQGVIHRDLKPANIMVADYGEVLVMDWGLAKVRDRPDVAAEGVVVDPAALDGQHSGDESPRTMDGAVMGTPQYMAPEQARGEVSALDERTDVYALGAILFELLTLRPAVGGSSAWEVIAKAATGQLESPSTVAPDRDIPWELEAIVTRAMALRPDDRYADVPAMTADVRAYIDGRLVGAARYSALQRLRRWVVRYRWPLAATLAPLIALATLLVVQDRQRRATHDRLIAEARALGGEARYTAAQARLRRALGLFPGSAAATTAQRDLLMARATARMQGLPAAGDLQHSWAERLARRRRGEVDEPESFEQREARERQTARLLLAIRDLELAREVAPDDAEVLARRQGAGRALGWLALGAGDHAMARFAFAALGDHGAPPEEVARLAGLVDQDRDAQVAFWLERLDDAVAAIDADLGKAEPGALLREEHIAEIAGYRHARVAAEVERLLRERVIAPAQGKTAWRQPERDLAIFLCHTLARLRGADAVPALRDALLAVDADDELAIEAALALCDTRAPAAYEILLAARGRWDATARWLRVRDRFARVPAPEIAASARAEAEQLYLQASDALERGELDVALKGLDRVIELDPTSAAAYLNRALAYEQKGDPKRALADLDRSLAREPLVLAYMARSRVRAALGQIDEALRDLDQLIASQPEVHAHMLRASLRQEAGQLEGALTDLDKAITQMPGDPRPICNKGNVLSELGRTEDALASYARALKLDPDHVPSLTNTASVLMGLGRLDEAAAKLDRVVALRPDIGEGYCNRGRIHGLRGREAQARADLARAMELMPDRHEPYTFRAEIEARRGRLGEAEADYRRALARCTPTSVSAYQVQISLAYLIARRGRGAEAVSLLGEAIDARPDLGGAHMQRGVLLLQMGQLDRALVDMTRALELFPSRDTASRGSAHANRAVVLLRLGRAADALADARAAVGVDPSSLHGYRLLANLLLQLEEWGQARKAYDDLIEREPSSANLANRARVLMQLGELDAAVRDARAAMAKNPRHPYPPGLLGAILIEQGKHAEAIPHLERSMTGDPSRRAQGYRGRARAALGDVDAGLKDLGAGISRRPGDADLRAFRAELRLGRGELKGASEDVEAGLKAEPKHTLCHLLRAQLLLRAGKREEGVALLERLTTEGIPLYRDRVAQALKAARASPAE